MMPLFVESRLDYLKFYVITEITLFSKCTPIATITRTMIYSIGVDLDVTAIGIRFAKRCRDVVVIAQPLIGQK